MKRAVGVILSIALVLASWKTVLAEELNNIPVQSDVERNLIDYIRGDDGKLLIQRGNYGYMTFISDFKSNALSLYLIELTDKLIDTGAAPGKDKYMEILLNIIATYDLDCADDVAKQSNMDNLKTLQDYAMDCAEMGRNAVSVIMGNNPAIDDLETALSIAIDGLGVLIDDTDNWLDAFSNLETVIQDYSRHDDFLRLIENKSEGELKAAAQTLRKGMERAIEIKLDTYKNVSEKNYENYEEFFFSDVFFEAIRQRTEYTEDEALKYFVDTGDEIITKVGMLESAWDLGKMIGTLVGNIAVGGENLINRVLEMMAIYDISIILQNELIETTTAFLENYGTSNGESLVNTYTTFSNYLIGCRIRGEYCLYSVVAGDAGLLSWFNQNSAEEARKWYDNKTLKILAIQNNLMEIYENKDIEITSYFEKYEQLIDKLDMMPTDFWQFPDADSYVSDNFYLEINEDLFSMKNEGAPYIKLYNCSIGNNIIQLDEVLKENGWMNSYKDERQYIYISIINDKKYILYVYIDENSNINSWYLNNWPQGEEIADWFLELQRGEQDTGADMYVENMYEYAEGEFLSNFSIEEVNGVKNVFLMFWHNYGASSSDEDFFFEWEDGKWEYEVIGNRSKKKFLLNFIPTEEGLIIKVTCMEGAYYEWQTGQKKEVWSEEEYKIKQN